MRGWNTVLIPVLLFLISQFVDSRSNEPGLRGLSGNDDLSLIAKMKYETDTLEKDLSVLETMKNDFESVLQEKITTQEAALEKKYEELLSDIQDEKISPSTTSGHNNDDLIVNKRDDKDCLVEEVERIALPNGTIEERIYYVTDESCKVIIPCDEKSSDTQSCQETSTGECVCTPTCIGMSTDMTQCIESSSGCKCIANWITDLFSVVDLDGNGKFSQDEAYAYYDKSSCVESFIFDGITYNSEEGSIAGYSDTVIEKFPWCSTKVDIQGNHIPGFWKFLGRFGIDVEWSNALIYDLNKDGMLSIQEVIAYNEAIDTAQTSRRVSETRFLNGHTCTLDQNRVQFLNNHVCDLDQDFILHNNFNKSPGALKVKRAFDAFNRKSGNELLSVMVIENGEKVAEYFNNVRGVTDKSLIYVWSVTKTVTALLVGQMLKEFGSQVSLGSKIFDILPELREKQESCTWSGNGQCGCIWPYGCELTNCFHLQDRKKDVTLLQLLNQASGMHDCMSDVVTGGLDPGTLGGISAKDSMHWLYNKEQFLIDLEGCSYYGECVRGAPFCSDQGFHYILANNVISYVVKEITGKTPGEYFAQKVAPSLGLDHSDYQWCTNDDGVSHGLHGMKMTTTAMAKIGQFFLQRGKTKMGQSQSDIVTEEFMNDFHVDKVIRKYVRHNNPEVLQIGTCTDIETNGSYECGNAKYEPPYYSFYTHVDRIHDSYCAIGTAGKLICWSPRKHRVVVITRTKEDHDSTCNKRLALRFITGDIANLEAMELWQYIHGELDGAYDFS